MRRARLEDRPIGRKPLAVDREAILLERRRGQSLGQIARSHGISRASVHRVLHQYIDPVPKGVEKLAS